MKKILNNLFLIQVFWWLLSSCHKETPARMVTLQIPPSTPVKQIINNNLQWTASYDSKIASSKLTELKALPSPYSANSIQAVYVLQTSNSYEQVKRGAVGSTFFYYEIENNTIILYRKMISFVGDFPVDMLTIPKGGKVVFH